MLFNSLEFAVFFPLVTLLYFLVPGPARVFVLLAASCAFYMAFVPAYILILFGVILVDYVAGRMIEHATGPRRKLLLAASLVANVGILAFFKYFNFFQANVAAVFGSFGHAAPFPALGIILPIGLSFHTFQSMSYTLEVYRGHVPAERSLPHFALYVLFYPQLVAGPIERPQNLLAQFHTTHRFDLARCLDGLRLMATGLFKKIIIADRLAVFVDATYKNPGDHSGATLLLATYFFAIQIYCDFSGYSDIARGAARVMGYELMLNFNRPYFATSVGDFWRRWHISLSTWFRDYVYIPLGGSRHTVPRRCVNLLIVFLLSGVWHGANWTFVVWGLLHGAFVTVEVLAGRGGSAERKKARGFAFGRALLVFNLTALAWVFFRAASVADAALILRRIATAFGSLALPGLSTLELTVALLLIAALFLTEHLGRERSVWSRLAAQPRWIRWGAYYLFAVAFLALALTGPQHQAQPFIYFQF